MARISRIPRLRCPAAWAIPLLLIVATIIGTSGCGWSEPKKEHLMRPTMTREEAVERVERHIKQTVAQLPAEARLTVARKTDKMTCGLLEDEEEDTRVRVEYGYWIDDLPRQNNQQYFDTVQKHWEDRGYRKLEFEKRERWIMYYRDSENFTLRLATDVNGYLSIRITSPCVWPNGTPEPEAG